VCGSNTVPDYPKYVVFKTRGKNLVMNFSEWKCLENEMKEIKGIFLGTVNHLEGKSEGSMILK
jgi:hypothetical protein